MTNQPKPKVAHLVRWFLPPTASFIRNQIMHTDRYVPSVAYLQIQEGHFQREIAEAYETVYPFRSVLASRVYAIGRILMPGVKRELLKALRRLDPDVLHVHYGVDALVYADTIRKLKVPTCVSFYGYDCTSFPRRFGGLGKRLLQRGVFDNPQVHAVLAMTEDMKRDLLALGCPEDKIKVHYYGTDTTPFYWPSRRRAEQPIRILILSGLQKKKGHTYLLEAFAEAQANVGVPMQLDIVGEGPERPAIEACRARLGLDNVTLHGAIPYGSDRHREFLEGSHLFAHPSVTSPEGDKEGIPGAIIEAMAAGLPIVSTYHAGIPFVIEDGVTGLLSPERDVEALALSITRLVRDANLRRRLGRAAQHHAATQLDIAQKKVEREAIYDQLAGGGRILRPAPNPLSIPSTKS